MDGPWLDTSLKVINVLGPLVVGALGFLRPLIDRTVRRKPKAVAELEFISAFLAFDIEYRNPLVVEQAFAAHFKHRYDYDELMALLRFRSPSKAFQLFRQGRAYLTLSGQGFAFRKEYESPRKRTARRWLYGALYFVLAYVGLIPLSYLEELVKPLGWLSIAPIVMWLFGFGLWAIAAIGISMSVKSAEELMEEQMKGRVTG